MKCKLLIVLILCFSGFEMSAQKTHIPDLTNIKFTVEEAPEWSALLKRSSGWFGGDGIYTIPYNGVESRQAGQRDSILFIFSDTMIGEVKNNTMMPGATMIHNSVAVLKGNRPDEKQMKFFWDKDTKGSPAPVFIPQTAQTDTSDYYWLGDGFINRDAGNNLYIFGYRVRNVSQEAFGFREVGNTLLKIPAGSKPPFREATQVDSPFYLTDEKGEMGSFGAGIYVSTQTAGAPNPDGYIYVYGVKGQAKKLLVSRVLPVNFEDFSKWKFWDGKEWVSDMHAAAAVTEGVSNELSLSELPDGRYALVFQLNGMSTTVGMRIGATPFGPFGPVIKLWDCQPDLIQKSFVVYNAKVHPALSKPNELLISYNINSVEFMKDLQVHPNLYRPRFIRVLFQ